MIYKVLQRFGGGEGHINMSSKYGASKNAKLKWQKNNLPFKIKNIFTAELKCFTVSVSAKLL